MDYRRRLTQLALLVVVAAVWPIVRADAQAPCPHADIRLDTEQVVDVDAICNTAQPWAEDGFRVFILLTDFRAQSEEQWFEFLDQAEAEAGQRDLSQPDGFEKNALAFEASTATDLAWGYNVTFGERLFDSALDMDATLFQIQDQMRSSIVAGEPTQAFTQALTISYAATHPPPSPWIWVGAGVLLAGALGAAAAA